MKKILPLLLSILPLSIFSQNIRFSVIGEPQISWMVPGKDNISRQGAIMGLNAGLHLDKFFTKNYAFSTGITISNLGGKLAYSDPLIYQTDKGKDTIPAFSVIKYKIQYISVPIGLKFKTNEIGYATYFANLGFNPMFRIKAHGSDNKDILNHDDISEVISLFNLNYFIHIGVEYSLGGSTALVGGLGYSAGFVDVTNRAIDKININSITFRVGVLF
jgi:hypothetical protein